jgi:hypothetical protein
MPKHFFKIVSGYLEKTKKIDTLVDALIFITLKISFYDLPKLILVKKRFYCLL